MKGENSVLILRYITILIVVGEVIQGEDFNSDLRRDRVRRLDYDSTELVDLPVANYLPADDKLPLVNYVSDDGKLPVVNYVPEAGAEKRSGIVSLGEDATLLSDPTLGDGQWGDGKDTSLGRSDIWQPTVGEDSFKLPSQFKDRMEPYSRTHIQQPYSTEDTSFQRPIGRIDDRLLQKEMIANMFDGKMSANPDRAMESQFGQVNGPMKSMLKDSLSDIMQESPLSKREQQERQQDEELGTMVDRFDLQTKHLAKLYRYLQDDVPGQVRSPAGDLERRDSSHGESHDYSNQPYGRSHDRADDSPHDRPHDTPHDTPYEKVDYNNANVFPTEEYSDAHQTEAFEGSSNLGSSLKIANQANQANKFESQPENADNSQNVQRNYSPESDQRSYHSDTDHANYHSDTDQMGYSSESDERDNHPESEQLSYHTDNDQRDYQENSNQKDYDRTIDLHINLPYPPSAPYSSTQTDLNDGDRRSTAQTSTNKPWIQRSPDNKAWGSKNPDNKQWVSKTPDNKPLQPDQEYNRAEIVKQLFNYLVDKNNHGTVSEKTTRLRNNARDSPDTMQYSSGQSQEKSHNFERTNPPNLQASTDRILSSIQSSMFPSSTSADQTNRVPSPQNMYRSQQQHQQHQQEKASASSFSADSSHNLDSRTETSGSENAPSLDEILGRHHIANQPGLVMLLLTPPADSTDDSITGEASVTHEIVEHKELTHDGVTRTNDNTMALDKSVNKSKSTDEDEDPDFTKNLKAATDFVLGDAVKSGNISAEQKHDIEEKLSNILSKQGDNITTRSTAEHQVSGQKKSMTPKFEKKLVLRLPEVPLNPVMYLSFDAVSKDAIIVDGSGNKNNARFEKSAALSARVLGTCGKAAEINHGSITWSGSDFKHKPEKAISIAMWVKVKKSGVINWFANGKKGQRMFYTKTKGTVVPAKVWTHVAGTFDSKTGLARIYINGDLEQEAQQTSGKKLPQNWLVNGIGSDFGDDSMHYVDELLVYDRPINSSEVRTLANRCIFNRMVLHFGFQNGNRTNVNDQSGLDNNGILTGGAALKTDCERCGGCLDLQVGPEPSMKIQQISVKNLPRVKVSIAVWVNLNDTKGVHDIFKTESGRGNVGYLLQVKNGKIRWYIASDKGRTIFDNTTKNEVVPEALWTHIIVSYNNENGRVAMYTNSLLKFKDTVPEGKRKYLPVNWDNDASIGDSSFHGYLDEFIMYNWELDNAEALYVRNYCADHPKLVRFTVRVPLTKKTTVPKTPGRVKSTTKITVPKLPGYLKSTRKTTLPREKLQDNSRSRSTKKTTVPKSPDFSSRLREKTIVSREIENIKKSVDKRAVDWWTIYKKLLDRRNTARKSFTKLRRSGLYPAEVYPFV